MKITRDNLNTHQEMHREDLEANHLLGLSDTLNNNLKLSTKNTKENLNKEAKDQTFLLTETKSTKKSQN